MANNLKEKILSSKVGLIGTLLFSVYTFAWGIIEPLNLESINSNRLIWRIILLAFAALVTIILSIRLSRSLLEKIDADGPDKTIQDSYSSTGNPQMVVVQDGLFGNVVRISGNYNSDEIDLIIRGSAQKAKKMELIYKSPGKKIDFYLRIGMLSADGQTSTTRWVRFDCTITVPDKYVNNAHELGIPYDSTSLKNNFNKMEIDIPEAVKKSFGQNGWVYNKIMIFRVRCTDATLKSISFKK